VTLVVEDGTGLPNSESYCSVDAATAYHAARNNTAWAALTTPAMEAALRLATDFMRQRYRLRWVGVKVTATQALEWPRAWVALPDSPSGYRSVPAYVPMNVVPSEVVNACAELALRSIAAPLSPDLGPQVVREKVGPIETQYLPAARQAPLFRAVDDMLAVYLKGLGSLDVVRG
jgi:hypothetical protein